VNEALTFLVFGLPSTEELTTNTHNKSRIIIFFISQ